jgi:hypothetical protein
LVVYLPLWKIWKSIGMMTFPIWWESHKIPWFQTTNQFPIVSLWKHGHFSQRSSATIYVTWHWSHRHNSPKSRALAALFPERP